MSKSPVEPKSYEHRKHLLTKPSSPLEPEESFFAISKQASALRDAIKERNFDLTKSLIEKKADVTAIINPMNATFLHQAAGIGDKKIIALLIESKADVDAKTRTGTKPLDMAVENGHIRAIELLLSKSTDTTTKVKPFYFVNAIKENWGEVIKLLLEKQKADISLEYMRTAVDESNLDVLSLLIKHKADLGATFLSGKTILHYAAIKGLTSIVETLIYHKCDPLAQDTKGNIPIIYSIKQHSSDIEGLLYLDKTISYGATTKSLLIRCPKQIEFTNPLTGRTLLHEVLSTKCADADLDIIELLIRKNVLAINAQDKDGNTPLHSLLSIKDLKYSNIAPVVKLLLENKADLTIQNKDGIDAQLLLDEAKDLFATPHRKVEFVDTHGILYSLSEEPSVLGKEPSVLGEVQVQDPYTT